MKERRIVRKNRVSQQGKYSTSSAVACCEDDLWQLLDSLDEPPFLLVLDCVEDPHNLGACMRTALGAGVQAVIVPTDRSVSMTDTVRRVACGAAEKLPLVRVTNLARTLVQLKDRGVWLVGAAHEAAQNLYELDLKGPLALVMGSEGKGLRRLTRKSCDFVAAIPMASRADCLNVSVATGVCLFEAVRQRILEHS
ncbi:MAG: 23S rRNA (guanosine(2251)-2'-O)-methyltransferase RlmB [Candidatus Zixiibacteriota bacterium]